jgi:integrase/recombinase XerC
VEDSPTDRGEIAAGTETGGAPHELSTAVHNFLEHCRREKNQPEQSIISYRSDLNLLVSLATVQAADSVTAFTPDLVRSYFLTLSKKGLKMSTLHRRRSTLNEFAKFGQRERYWNENPVEIGQKKIRRPKLVPRTFDDSERDRLMDLPLVGREKVFRALIYFGGLRVTEACMLRRTDVRFGTRPAMWVHGKGSKERVVPMAPELQEILREWVTLHPSADTKAPLVAQPNGRHYRRKTVERWSQRWGEAADVRDCTPHRFRHTFATTLLSSGADIRHIQDLLGHSRLDTTEIYTKVASKDLVDAVALLSKSRGTLPRVTGPSSAPPSSVGK